MNRTVMKNVSLITMCLGATMLAACGQLDDAPAAPSVGTQSSALTAAGAGASAPRPHGQRPAPAPVAGGAASPSAAAASSSLPGAATAGGVNAINGCQPSHLVIQGGAPMQGTGSGNNVTIVPVVWGSAALGYALFLIFAPFAGAICWAVFLAFLLFPLNARLRRRLRGHPALAAALDAPFLSRWAFDVELLGRLLAGGAATPLPISAIVEVPLAVWHDVKGSKLGAGAMVRSLQDLARIGVDLAGRRRTRGIKA